MNQEYVHYKQYDVKIIIAGGVMIYKETDDTKILEARIAILRDNAAEKSDSFDKMNNKMFAIMGLLLTLGGLLSYDVFRIKQPTTVLEYIVLIAALAGLGLTAALIGYDYQTRKNWSIPIGEVEDIKLDYAKNYKEALKIIHDDYLMVNKRRDEVLALKARFVNGSLRAFTISVILLIALKIGG